jgi:hypothetical protein
MDVAIMKMKIFVLFLISSTWAGNVLGESQWLDSGLDMDARVSALIKAIQLVERSFAWSSSFGKSHGVSAGNRIGSHV